MSNKKPRYEEKSGQSWAKSVYGFFDRYHPYPLVVFFITAVLIFGALVRYTE